MNKTVACERRDAPGEVRNQPARKSNIDALTAYFESGVKPAGTHGDLGIELEHTIVRDDGSPVPYRGEHGVAWLLDQLRSSYPDVTTDPEGDLLGVSRPGEAVTIEPSAQLELSAGPFANLAAAERAFASFEELLEGILSPLGMRAITEGYHPTAAARDLELIPKQRYDFMNRYLGERDTCGPCMMRGSASTQISIDYTSVEDCLRKLRLAYAAVPLLSLICDNAPVFEGTPRTRKLVRTHIWRHVDNDRCGLVPGVLDPSFTLRRYASYILDTPAILVPCSDGGWRYSEQTFGDIYAERTMTRAEVEHAVSMFFNDVRLKTYIEIRPADAMPVPYALAYAALVKGLFYLPENLDVLDALFSHVRSADYERAKVDLMARGYEAEVYKRPAAKLCDRLFELARRGLDADEQAYLEPLGNLVERRITLADLAEEKR
ncbi:glutamate-cysteine ligase family protein [Rubneribacter sp.]